MKKLKKRSANIKKIYMHSLKNKLRKSMLLEDHDPIQKKS